MDQIVESRREVALHVGRSGERARSCSAARSRAGSAWRRSIRSRSRRGSCTPRARRRDAVDAVRREGAAEGGDPRRQPGRLPRAAPALRPPRPGSRGGVHACRSASPSAKREGTDVTVRRLLGRRAARAAGGPRARARRDRDRGDRPAHAEAARPRRDRRLAREDAARLVVVSEGALTGGFASEVVARVADAAWDAARPRPGAGHGEGHADAVRGRARARGAAAGRRRRRRRRKVRRSTPDDGDETSRQRRIEHERPGPSANPAQRRSSRSRRASSTELFGLGGRVACVTGAAAGSAPRSPRASRRRARASSWSTSTTTARRATVATIAAQGGQALAVHCDVDRARERSRRARARSSRTSSGRSTSSSTAPAPPSAAPPRTSPRSASTRSSTLNIKGTYLPCQAIGRHMLAQGSGSIINLASIGGFAAFPHASAYVTSKGARRPADARLRRGVDRARRPGERHRSVPGRLAALRPARDAVVGDERLHRRADADATGCCSPATSSATAALPRGRRLAARDRATRSRSTTATWRPDVTMIGDVPRIPPRGGLARDRIAAELRNAIVHGRLQPGERLVEDRIMAVARGDARRHSRGVPAARARGPRHLVPASRARSWSASPRTRCTAC